MRLVIRLALAAMVLGLLDPPTGPPKPQTRDPRPRGPDATRAQQRAQKPKQDGRAGRPARRGGARMGLWRLADGRLTAGGLGSDPRDHPRSFKFKFWFDRIAPAAPTLLA